MMKTLLALFTLISVTPALARVNKNYTHVNTIRIVERHQMICVDRVESTRCYLGDYRGELKLVENGMIHPVLNSLVDKSTLTELTDYKTLFIRNLAFMADETVAQGDKFRTPFVIELRWQRKMPRGLIAQGTIYAEGVVMIENGDVQADIVRFSDSQDIEKWGRIVNFMVGSTLGADLFTLRLLNLTVAPVVEGRTSKIVHDTLMKLPLLKNLPLHRP